MGSVSKIIKKMGSVSKNRQKSGFGEILPIRQPKNNAKTAQIGLKCGVRFGSMVRFGSVRLWKMVW